MARTIKIYFLDQMHHSRPDSQIYIRNFFADLIGIPAEIGRGNMTTLSDEELKSELFDIVIFCAGHRDPTHSAINL